MKKQGGFIGIIVILGALILILGGIVHYGKIFNKAPSLNKPAEESNLMTDFEPIIYKSDNPAKSLLFTNNFQGYTLTIPPGFKAVIFNKQAGILSNTYISQVDESSDSGNLKIGVENLRIRLSFKETANYWMSYYKGSTSELGNSSSEVIKEEDIIIDGRNGVKYIIKYNFEGEIGIAKWTYIPLNSEYLLYFKQNTRSPNLAIKLDQILSTFHFLNDPSVTPAKKDKFLE